VKSLEMFQFGGGKVKGTAIEGAKTITKAMKQLLKVSKSMH